MRGGGGGHNRGLRYPGAYTPPAISHTVEWVHTLQQYLANGAIMIIIVIVIIMVIVITIVVIITIIIIIIR